MTEKAPESHLLFRPDAFFLKPWRGWGVVRDAGGRVIDRYTGEGQGRAGSRSATSRMTFNFASGLVQSTEIDILSDDDGHYFARDPRSGIEGRGRFIGDEFRWTFDAMPIPNLSGPLAKLLRAQTTATYTLTSPSTAVGLTRVRLFGIVVRTMTTFFQHVDAPARSEGA